MNGLINPTPCMTDMKKVDEPYTIYQNVYGSTLTDLEAEFQKNAAYLVGRKNGMYLYHEILSITKAKELAEGKQRAILQ